MNHTRYFLPHYHHRSWWWWYLPNLW